MIPNVTFRLRRGVVHLIPTRCRGVGAAIIPSCVLSRSSRSSESSVRKFANTSRGVEIVLNMPCPVKARVPGDISLEGDMWIFLSPCRRLVFVPRRDCTSSCLVHCRGDGWADVVTPSRSWETMYLRPIGPWPRSCHEHFGSHLLSIGGCCRGRRWVFVIP